MSSWTTTVPYSVRNNAPVGHTSRQAASVQCLHTSLDISHRIGLRCSINATCRHEFAPSVEVLSYDSPVQTSPSSGTWFHSLHATSQALQPMQIDVSVKNPTRGFASAPYPRALTPPLPPCACARRNAAAPAPAAVFRA